MSLASFGRQRSAVDISFPRHQLVPQCFGSNYECSAVRVLGDVETQHKKMERVGAGPLCRLGVMCMKWLKEANR